MYFDKGKKNTNNKSKKNGKDFFHHFPQMRKQGKFEEIDPFNNSNFPQFFHKQPTKKNFTKISYVFLSLYFFSLIFFSFKLCEY